MSPTESPTVSTPVNVPSPVKQRVRSRSRRGETRSGSEPPGDPPDTAQARTISRSKSSIVQMVDKGCDEKEDFQERVRLSKSIERGDQKSPESVLHGLDWEPGDPSPSPARWVPALTGISPARPAPPPRVYINTPPRVQPTQLAMQHAEGVVAMGPGASYKDLSDFSHKWPLP